MLHFQAPKKWVNVVRLAFAPDGSALVGGCDGFGVVSWDVASGAIRSQHKLASRKVFGMLVAPDASFVCVPSGWFGVVHLSYPELKLLSSLNEAGYVQFAALSDDGTRVFRNRAASAGVAVVTGPPKWTTFLWETSDRGWIPHTGTFLAGSRQVITVERSHPLFRGSRLAVRDAATGAVVRSVECTMKEYYGLVPSADGRQVVLMAGRSLYIWDATDWAAAPKKVRNDTQYNFTGVVFHPSGRYLAATSNDTTVKLFDTTTWEVARAFTWKVGKLRSVAFSPDGTLAAAGSDRGTVVVWDVDL